MRMTNYFKGFLVGVIVGVAVTYAFLSGNLNL